MKTFSMQPRPSQISARGRIRTVRSACKQTPKTGLRDLPMSAGRVQGFGLAIVGKAFKSIPLRWWNHALRLSPLALLGGGEPGAVEIIIVPAKAVADLTAINVRKEPSMSPLTVQEVQRRKALLLVKDALRRSYCFIHINKCGGTSVEQVLGLPTLHDTARHRRALMGAGRWAQVKRFSFVRNPFTRVRSQYRFRVMTNQNGLADRHLNLSAWVKRAYGESDPAYCNNPGMFASCFDWLTDENGDLLVELVVKLENIQTDWALVEAYLGLKARLPVLNSTQKLPRVAEGFDEESLDIIRHRFSRDFDTFGYDTNNRPA